MNVADTLLGLVYALFLGALFHVWRNGGLGRLLFFLLLSVAGAAAGQWLGTLLNWSALPLGGLNVGAVTIGSMLFLVTGYWLSLVQITGKAGTGNTKRKV